MDHKYSEMLLDVAGDSIDLDDSIEKMQEVLFSAATAWNIACLPPKKQKAMLKEYIRDYKKLNPNSTQKEMEEVLDELRVFIERKRNLHPISAHRL